MFCRRDCTDVNTHVVPDARFSNLINRTPIIRRLRDWQALISDSHFDRYVSARLTTTDVFQGVTGQCAESIRKAQKLGCGTLLDVVTTHIEDFGEEQRRECIRFGVRPSINRGLRRRIQREYENADLIRVMSKRAQQTFLDRGFTDGRVRVVTPPLEFEEFPEAKFDEPKFRVSFVGLIEPWKGFHYLIEAFNSLNLPDSELILWGGSGSRPANRYLQEQMARNPAIVVRPVEVRSLGYGEVYAKSSVLVHPSLADGFGYVVAEAMASGIPVIVTDKTGAADLIVDGQNGYIVPPRDSEAIRDRLENLANNPGLLREMGRAARETARSLTFEKFRQQYVSCLDALSA